MTFYSQFRQDEFLETIFKGFKHGIFVDVGAHDGKTFNNTLYFEETHGWTGTNIEPIPAVYEKLRTNRPNCLNMNYAIDEADGEADFVCNTGHTEMLSGLYEHLDPRHISRIKEENKEFAAEPTIITVPTKRLESVISYKHVHYLSIDVEGAEKQVINSINFDKLYIDVIGFENNYPDVSDEIVEHLESK